MFCPDGFVLLHEILDECMNVAGRTSEQIPGWFSQYPASDAAIEQAMKPDPDEDVYCEWFGGFSDLDASWRNLYERSLYNWLMFRFLQEQRGRIYIALPNGGNVRVSSQALYFTMRSRSWSIRDTDIFPRDPLLVAYLAMAGLPYERRVTLPVYTLNVNPGRHNVRRIMHVEEALLEQFNGLPLCWKPDGQNGARAVVEDILRRGLKPIDDLDDQIKDAPGRPRGLRNSVKEAIRQHYPDGINGIQAKEITVSLKRSYGLDASLDTVRRAIEEMGE